MSDLHRAFQVEDAGSFQYHSLSQQTNSERTASPGGLKRSKRGLSQASGPVRGKHAVSRARHRVLGNPLRGGEITALEVITAGTRRGHNDTRTILPCHRAHV